MDYSFIEGLKRGLKRAAKIGAIVFLIAGISAMAEILPADYVWIAPSLAALVAFLEKLERNHREIAGPAKVHRVG